MSTEPYELRAGDWEATLSADGALSGVRVRGIEVLHGLMIVVRDDAWGTVPASVDIHSVEVGAEGFTVGLRASHASGDVRFDWEGSLLGTPEGIAMAFDGVAMQRFRSNRIGFVALQPLGWSGRPVTVVHPDGSTSDSVYPVMVAPHQPFLDVAGFRQATDEGVVSISFEGDVFETEDQRNWSDASYKTYSRPLSFPFPVSWQQGDVVRQVVRLAFDPYRVTNITDHHVVWSGPIVRFDGDVGGSGPSVRFGEVVRLPAIGLTIGPDDDLDALTAEIAVLAPDHLRVDVVAGHTLSGATTLRAALAQPVPIELVVHVGFRPENALADLRSYLGASGRPLARIVVFDAEAPATTSRAVDAVGQAIGDYIAGIPLIVGTDDNLAELNRNPVTLERLGASAVVFCLNPGVHDLRPASMLETADAVPAMLATARQMAGGAVALGPLTLRPRRNIYRDDARIDRTGRDASATDERQHTPFAAAWLIATLSAAIESGVDAVTLFEISGPRGLVASPGAARSPLFDVVVELGKASQAILCLLDRPSEVAALALADDTGTVTTLLLSNRTDTEQTIALTESGGRQTLAPFGIQIVRLDAAAAII